MPISQRLSAVLEMRRLDPGGSEYPASAFVLGDPFGRHVRSVRREWEAARAKANLLHWHLADLRHDAASRYEQAGVPVSVSKLLGHTSLTTTTTCLNTLRRELHRAVQTREAASGKLANEWQSGEQNPSSDEPPTTPPKSLN